MHTVPELVALLGLSTENQVRNRIEAVRDILLGLLRRGPNNQLLVTDDGLRLLRDLQTLCETGHTLAEASNIIRYRQHKDEEIAVGVSSTIAQNRAIPDQASDLAWRTLVEHLASEVRELTGRVAALEAAAHRKHPPTGWWERWR